MRPVLSILAILVAGCALLASFDVSAQTASEINASGVELYETEHWAQAIDLFADALNLEPQNATIRSNLSNARSAYASALAESGDLARAIRQLERTIQIDPTNVRPFIQLGVYFLQEGLINDAIFRLEEAVELAPGDVDAHYLLGESYYKDSDVTSALEQWDWVEANDPGRPGLAERIESARREERVESDFAGRMSRHFNVTYDREAEGTLVREVLGYLEEAYREIGQTLGRVYPPTPIQVSLYTVRGFSETTQLDAHVGAMYDGTKIRCPVIDEEGERLPGDELRRRLFHEYVHVVVRHLAKDNVPWWLNEGLAETLSRDLSDRERAFLRHARDQDALFQLSELTESQLENREAAALMVAYRQSHATVGFLKKRFGTRQFALMLTSIADGEDPETALRRHFRFTYHTLELAVADYIQNG